MFLLLSFLLYIGQFKMCQQTAVLQVRELRTMSINVPWLEVLKACYPNAQVIMVTMMIIMVVMLMIYGDDHYGDWWW